MAGFIQRSEYIHLTTGKFYNQSEKWPAAEPCLHSEISFSAGNYSRLNVEFELQRSTGYYIPQVYIPCTMIVILSWISFWLTRRATNVRLAICVTAMILMPICLQTLSTQLPKTSYIKAVDVYTGVCMSFVFLALVGKSEFISWHYFCFILISFRIFIEISFFSIRSEFAYISNTGSDKEDISAQIDLIFRYGYAALYVIFNIIYWLVY